MTALALAVRDRRLLAACRDAPPDLFFPEGNPASAAVRAQVARARAVCADCPLRHPCLEYAMATGQEHGIWAGTTPEERFPAPGIAPALAGSVYCGTGRHLKTEENTAPHDRCRPCRQENWRRNHPPSGRGRGNSETPRERDGNGRFTREMAA